MSNPQQPYKLQPSRFLRPWDFPGKSTGVGVQLPPEKSLFRSRSKVRTRHGTTDLFQIEKGVHQGYILSPCLFNLYAEHIMQNAGLDEA